MNAHQTATVLRIKDRAKDRGIPTKDSVPIRMQGKHFTRRRKDPFRVSSTIPFRNLGRVALNRVKRLMKISDDVQHPNKIIGAHIVRRTR